MGGFRGRKVLNSNTKDLYVRKILVKHSDIAPLTTQVWGEKRKTTSQSPPELGDLEGTFQNLREFWYLSLAIWA
jgi:hypothetical protein